MFISDREKSRLAQAYDAWYRHMRAVWDAQPEWYVWVTQGQPILSANEYERLLTLRRTKPRSKP